MQLGTLSQRKRGFSIHFFAFVAGIIGMVALNLWLGEPYWVLWVILGWGIGIVSHWFFVLGPGASKSET